MLQLYSVCGRLLNSRVQCSSCCLLTCLGGNVTFTVLVNHCWLHSDTSCFWRQLFTFYSAMYWQYSQSHIVMFLVVAFLILQCHVLAVSVNIYVYVVILFSQYFKLLLVVQLVQNATVHLVCGVRKYDHITQVLTEHYTGFQSNTVLNVRSSFCVSRQYMDLHQAIPLIYYSYTDQLDHCDQTH